MRIKINDQAITQWKQRWEELSSSQFKNDYSVAQLASEVRAEFPEGDGGDLQFRAFTKKHLGGCNSKTFLEKAKAFSQFTANEWHRLGGWQGITFLLSLTKKQRGLVLGALHGAGPFHYTTIRTRALKLGIVSGHKQGRSTLTKSEERVMVLRQFIAALYKKRDDLPTLPAEVRWAMSPTLMSSIKLASARA
ncbi:MAG TPA: hypothetical protein VFT22_07120 [Kofleriaceae bacterium]|nr:hypothetical protein [Kofleriaceae bacterium]